ncbi:MAG: integrase core domain-containing protein, partial [Gammaproteobacteria bacterium]|nr:integrase core domain-containing protein [Gammaproteobacteria bacterium]
LHKQNTQNLKEIVRIVLHKVTSKKQVYKTRDQARAGIFDYIDCLNAFRRGYQQVAFHSGYFIPSL